MLSGSFWSSAHFSSAGDGGLGEIIDRGEGKFTLQEILSHDQVIQECKYMNQQLCEYLSKPQVVRELIKYIITLPPDAQNSADVGGSSDSRGGITTAASMKLAREAKAKSESQSDSESSSENDAAAAAAPTSSTAWSDSDSSDDEEDSAEAKALAEQKYPYQASELFSCEINSMLDAIFEPEDVTATSSQSTMSPLENVAEEEDGDSKEKGDSGSGTPKAPSPVGSPAPTAALSAAPSAASQGTLSSPSASPRLPILDLLLSFLDHPAPIDPAHASYFRKVMVVLIQRKYEPLVKYMAQQGTLDKLLNHIGLYSIMELCPLSSTPVTLVDGRTMTLGEVQKGDQLWTSNGATTKVLAHRLERVSNMIRMRDDDGREFTVTPDHTLVLLWSQQPFHRCSPPETIGSYRTLQVCYYDANLRFHATTIAKYTLSCDEIVDSSSLAHLPNLGCLTDESLVSSIVSDWLAHHPQGKRALRAGSLVEMSAQQLLTNWHKKSFKRVRDSLRSYLAPIPIAAKNVDVTSIDGCIAESIRQAAFDRTPTQVVQFMQSDDVPTFAPTCHYQDKVVYMLPTSSSATTEMTIHQLVRAWKMIGLNTLANDQIVLTSISDMLSVLEMGSSTILTFGADAQQHWRTMIESMAGVDEITSTSNSLSFRYQMRPITVFTTVEPCQWNKFTQLLNTIVDAHTSLSSPSGALMQLTVPSVEEVTSQLSSGLLTPEAITGDFEIAKLMVDSDTHTYTLANGCILHNCIMIGWDDGLGGNQDVAWLVQADLTGKLIDKLNPIWETEYNQPDVLINASRALVDVVVKCPAPSHNPLITRLLATPCQEKLFKHMFAGSSLALSNALSIVIVLVQRYANRLDLGEEIMDEVKAAALAAQAAALDAPEDVQTSFDLSASESSSSNTLPEPFHSLVPHLERILALLTTEEQPEIEWSYGRGRAFGETRLKVVELILVLVRCKVPEVEQIFVSTNLLSKLLDAFTDYPWNSMLQGLVESVIRTILESLQDSCLRSALLIDARLSDRIIEACERNRKVCERGRGFRLGYMGHLLRISEAIEQYLFTTEIESNHATTREMLLGSLEAVERWSAYVHGPMADEAETWKVVMPPINSIEDDFNQDEVDALAIMARTMKDANGANFMHDHQADQQEYQFDPDDSNSLAYDYSSQMENTDDWANFNSHFSDAAVGESPGASSPAEGENPNRPYTSNFSQQRHLIEFALGPDEDDDDDDEDDEDDPFASIGNRPSSAATTIGSSAAPAAPVGPTSVPPPAADDFADFEADFNSAS